ncbi:MAG: tRNA (adenosine(37)-N6)-dimethylallyltransferase MiaA [Bacteroidaceae bacterium]|nr:tRNA (adenosine(37)-N6)-dimethylallyltransferase MiaA [Bacteroidaceae bacterium]
MRPTLIVLLGPTAVGKTSLSIQLAKQLDAPIVSADSRQMFRGMEIGTAAPTDSERNGVPHFFIGVLAPDQYYSAARYEAEALSLLTELMKRHETIILCGGSMLYLDAVCRGIDDIPTISDAVRSTMRQRLYDEGIEALQEELKRCDPAYHARCDLNNSRRVVHALEVYYMTGRPYSTFLTGKTAQRPFNIVKIGLKRCREELFARISQRTAAMIDRGLIDEARQLCAYRYCNALNTVGYKEAFQYLDGAWTIDYTREKIARNTRVYAKKQMTWFQRDADIHWFDAEDEKSVFQFVQKQLHH